MTDDTPYVTAHSLSYDEHLAWRISNDQERRKLVVEQILPRMRESGNIMPWEEFTQFALELCHNPQEVAAVLRASTKYLKKRQSVNENFYIVTWDYDGIIPTT